jgi:hypothetical protein
MSPKEMQQHQAPGNWLIKTFLMMFLQTLYLADDPLSNIDFI